jgi:hypothetical protein
MRPCPKCGQYVSILASLCRHCWNDLDAADARTRVLRPGTARKLATVVAVLAVLILGAFVSFQFVVERNLEAEHTLDATAQPAPKATHASSRPAPVAVESPPARPSSEVATHGTVPPSGTIRDAADTVDCGFPHSSAIELQGCYWAIMFSFVALICALVAFARAWR